MALFRPTCLSISEKSATYTIKWSYTIIWQVRVGKINSKVFLKLNIVLISNKKYPEKLSKGICKKDLKSDQGFLNQVILVYILVKLNFAQNVKMYWSSKIYKIEGLDSKKMRSYTVEKRLGRGSKPDVSVLQSLHNGSKYFQSIYRNILQDTNTAD